MRTVLVKILGSKGCQRYSIARAIIQAQTVFESQHPEFRLDVQEITTSEEILHYTPVLAYPSLVIGEKLVCVGRFPAKAEILGWLEDEILKEPVQGLSQP